MAGVVIGLGAGAALGVESAIATPADRTVAPAHTPATAKLRTAAAAVRDFELDFMLIPLRAFALLRVRAYERAVPLAL
jgi:hypothetical protein